MIFKLLEIHNFLSISEARLSFDGGISLVQGVNHDMSSEGEESNGSGKSSLWEAPEWCLWGTLTRDTEKGDKVINSAAGKNCLVRLVFECRGHSWEVIRYRKHDEHGTGVRWWVDGVEKSLHDTRESNAALEEALPMSKKVYRYAVQVGQGMPDKFLGLSESQKQDLLSEIIDLSIYDRALNIASNGMKEADVESRTAAEVLRTFEGQEQEFRTAAETARKEHQTFMGTNRDAYRQRLGELEKQQADLEVNIRNLQGMATEAEEESTALGEAAGQAQAAYDQATSEARARAAEFKRSLDAQAEEEWRLMQQEITAAEEKAAASIAKWESSLAPFEQQAADRMQSCASVTAALAPLTSELSKLKGAATSCPTCGQDIDVSHLAPRITQLEAEIEDKKSEVEKESQLQSAAKGELDSQRTKLAEEKAKWETYARDTRNHFLAQHQQTRQTATSQYNKMISNEAEATAALDRAAKNAREKLSFSQQEHQRIVKLISESQTHLSQLQKGRQDLYSAMQEHEAKAAQLMERVSFAESQAKALAEKKAEKQAEIDKYEKVRNHWAYWKTNAPNLRAAAMEQILEYLNERISVYMNTFSGGVMSLRLIQATHGKSTKIKTELFTPGGTYGMSSGGERRRIDLAIYLSLSDLLQATSGYSCNLLVADEIMDGLSPCGVSRFLDVLRQKAEAGISVFVITHNPSVLQSHSFDSIVTVERRGGKATIA